MFSRGKEEIKLRVSEALGQDVGYGKARIDSKARRTLNVLPGDVIEIEGKKKVPLIVWRLFPEDEGRDIIRIDNMTRKNAGVSLSDRVVVRLVHPQPAKSVSLAPVISKTQQLQFGEGIESLIKRGLLKRPVSEGDTIIVPGIALFGNALPFGVVDTFPKGTVIIDEDTKVSLKEKGVEATELAKPRVSYEDIGGLRDEIDRIREMIELPLKHPELFDRLGIEPPKGVLLWGPPGTGKTMIAKAVANESGASFFTINGPEIMSKFYGQSEENLRKMFQQATKESPSIIFIDEIDAIAPKREETHGEVERRVVSQLLTLMDGLTERGKLIVIGATNIPDSLDPALRRPGRFDREIVIGVPDKNGRKEIVQIHTRGMPLAEDVKLDYLSDISYGFVGADLAALAREAAMNALRRHLPEIDLEKPIPTELLEKMEVKMDDFKEALKGIEPSALREVLVEIPSVTWEDIGGLSEVKQMLSETIEWPLKNPESFTRLGIRPPRGILLYGPPGTGKTLMAKAVANESKANFLSIKGPEVFSKWVGESEKAVRELFKKAKQAAPSIVFLDELDAIAPHRGMREGSHVTETVVNQLLTSMDGLESMEGVVVIGATNRPDMIDPALMRAGRFDKLILIEVPDEKAREEIFKVHLKRTPLNKDVNLKELAQMTEWYVGADIETICREAVLSALRESMKTTKVKQAHFMEALERIRPSVTKETIESYRKMGERLTSGIAGRKKEEEIAPEYI
ncbi:MAG TPA: CDC48 family AAA ATPase [Thermoplasmata archaeon]|nr:CDC48 family AAA ATPase [Thermoplasmata archaeon]